MHMHDILYDMRTTIELSETQRAELLKLAAQRGYKGYSQIIQEALDGYLRDQSSKRPAIDAALKLMGSLPEKVADQLEEKTKSLRGRWR